MLTFLTAAALGAYAANRTSFFRDGSIACFTVDYSGILQDAIAFFALIGFICNWVISIGRTSRNYVDSALLPWMNDRGIKIELPSVSAPSIQSVR